MNLDKKGLYKHAAQTHFANIYWLVNSLRIKLL